MRGSSVFLGCWLCAFALAGCMGVLGVDFDPRTRNTNEGAAEDASTHPTEPVSNGGTNADASLADAGTDAERGPLPEHERLAALRVRIADAVTFDRYLATRSWTWWVDEAKRGHAIRFADGAERTLPIGPTSANDDVLVRRGASDIYSAETGERVAELWGLEPTAVEHAIFVFQSSSFNSIEVGVWRPSAPLTKLMTLPTASSVVLGTWRDTMFVRDATATRIHAVDLDATSPRTIDLGVDPIAVSGLADGVVVTHLAGFERRMVLVSKGGAVRSISDAIADAESPIPTRERALLDTPTTIDEWILFAAQAGLLAFRPRDARLIALQLRSPNAPYAFFGAKVVAAPRTVMFTVSGDLQGLYAMPLDGVLPP